MGKDKDILQRTFAFAVSIVELADKLSRALSPARSLSFQILRSGTSIGANVEEAQAAESKADFIHKYNIALKEARETKYWLRLLDASKMASDEDLVALTKESDEICRIIAQITINARNKK